MKYYTYQEHHIFCIKSGIPNGEVWKQVVKLGWMPEGIYHMPDDAFDPKQKVRVKKYQSTPKARAKKKEIQSTPEFKAWQKAYRDRPENRAKQIKDRSTPEFKAWRKEYDKRRYLRNKR